MGIDPLSLGVEGAAIGEAGAKGAEGAALAPVATDAAAGGLAAGEAGTAAASGGLGSLDALAAGLTPSGASALAPDALSVALGAGAAGAAGGVGDVLSGAGGGFNSIDAAAGVPGINGAPAAATPTIAAAASPAPTGGLSAGGLAGPSGGADALAQSTPLGAASGVDPAALPGSAGAATPAASTASPASTGIMGFLKSNPGLVASLGAGVAGTALSPMLSRLINKVPQQGNLDALAAQESGIASQQQQLSQTLTDPLTSGKLPTGAEQSVSTAINDAVSTTKARYANLGLSGSTMEADAIANIQNQATGLRFNIAQQMAQTGEAAIGQASSALGLQDQVYNQLMSAQISQDNNLQTAIARFAGAAAGASTGKGVNVQLGGSNS